MLTTIISLGPVHSPGEARGSSLSTTFSFLFDAGESSPIVG